MFRYLGFGYAIDSEFLLPELSGREEGPADITIRHGSVPLVDHRPALQEEFVFNTLAGNFHLLRGSEILAQPLPGSGAAMFRTVLLGRVMAYLLRQRGWLPLHASVVAKEDKAICFLGPSGSGKSTTAAAFLRSGYEVISDDVGLARMAGDRSEVAPGLPRLRLFSDSLNLLQGLPVPACFDGEKNAVDVRAGAGVQPVELMSIYVLQYGDVIGADRLPYSAAAAFMSRHSFLKRRRAEPEVSVAHLARCAAVAGATPAYRLTRPKSLRKSTEVVAFVENHLAGSPSV